MIDNLHYFLFISTTILIMNIKDATKSEIDLQA